MAKRLKPLAWLLIVATTTILIILIVRSVDSWRERVEILAFDLLHSNPEVTRKQQIREIFSGFHKIEFDDIPKEFRNRSGMNKRENRNKLRHLTFYKVRKSDLYRRIAGKDRLRDLVSADNGHRRESIFSDREFYFALDTDVLHLLMDIRRAMAEKGLDVDELDIISGYRTPAHNRNVGGKSESRHQLGDAIDLMIGDVDGNGRVDREDKRAVVGIARKVIGNRGGLGVYARSIHIDTRGHAARW